LFPLEPISSISACEPHSHQRKTETSFPSIFYCGINAVFDAWIPDKLKGGGDASVY
jgi:hypothetical protein